MFSAVFLDNMRWLTIQVYQPFGANISVSLLLCFGYAMCLFWWPSRLQCFPVAFHLLPAFFDTWNALSAVICDQWLAHLVLSCIVATGWSVNRPHLTSTDLNWPYLTWPNLTPSHPPVLSCELWLIILCRSCSTYCLVAEAYTCLPSIVPFRLFQNSDPDSTIISPEFLSSSTMYCPKLQPSVVRGLWGSRWGLLSAIRTSLSSFQQLSQLRCSVAWERRSPVSGRQRWCLWGTRWMICNSTAGIILTRVCDCNQFFWTW